MTKKNLIVWGLLIVGLLAVAAESSACPVCFGESDAPIIKGLEASILFMLGVTYSLIFGGVATFILLRRRARRQLEQAAETA